MPRILMVIAPTEFRDEEYAQPKAVFEAAGAEVTTASVTPRTCTGRFGMTAEATMSIADALERDWDAVVFVGGAGSAVFFDDPDAHTLARRQLESERAVAAICAAPTILARAGLLEGVSAIAFPTRQAGIVERGAVLVDEPVVLAGHIVTARDYEASTQFAEAVLAAIAGNAS